MQAIINKTSVHNVYVVDEKGMANVFADLKQALVLQHHATLIYFSGNDSFIFNKELEILQKRYPAQFILCSTKEIPDYDSTILQELLEAIINSNTKDKLMFTLSGDEELINVVSNQLWFLGICETQIKSKSIF